MASGALNPITNPQDWDIVKIGQVRSPGVCQLSGFKRQHEFDVKKGKGTIGATLTFVGKPPVKGSIKFWLWTPDHFVQWDLFRPLLKYDPTKKGVNAIDIYHPALADIDLKSVIAEEIGAIEHEGKQLYAITVALVEYLPPPKKSAVSTPGGSIDTAPTTPPKQPPGSPIQKAVDQAEADFTNLTQKAGLT